VNVQRNASANNAEDNREAKHQQQQI